MRFVLRPVAFIALALTGLLDMADAQDLHPSRRPSPMGMARITLDDTYVRVVYSRPYKRGRENIFGSKESEALVPYGEIWRTGANEGTEITVTGDVTIGGKKLSAGTYSLLTTPGEDSWKIHFNSALGLSGTGIFKDGKFTALDLPQTDVLVVEAVVGSLDEEVDQFTIALDGTDTGADLCFRWIKTEVCVPVTAP
jgi:hypothetical protein